MSAAFCFWPVLRRGAVAVVLASMVAACGTGSDSPTSVGPAGQSEGLAGRSEPDGELAYGLRRCDPDGPMLSADPALYGDEPIYVANEQPTDEVRSWAQGRPAYEDIWIDRDHNGWIAVGFSRDVEDRQGELQDKFPGVGVVAVQVPATDAELAALRSDVEAALEGLSNWVSGYSVARGTVDVTVPVLDEETLARLAPFAGPMLCVDGADPADAVPDQPQPTQGDGWRLLGTDKTGESYRTGVATNVAQYERLWRQAGLSGEGPAVDFETEIVIWFGAVYGSSCPIRLDDVVIDPAERVVHGDFVFPGNPTMCTADANPEAYVVAVEREVLPEAAFAVQLTAEDPPRGAPRERTTVPAGLRKAGAEISDDDLGFDSAEAESPPEFAPPPGVESIPAPPPTMPPNFEAAAAPPPDALESEIVLEPGFPFAVMVDLSCDLEVIGPVNETMWRAASDELADGPPSAWHQSADGGLIEAELLLETGPARLTLTIEGTGIPYAPVPASQSAVMVCP